MVSGSFVFYFVGDDFVLFSDCEFLVGYLESGEFSLDGGLFVYELCFFSVKFRFLLSQFLLVLCVNVINLFLNFCQLVRMVNRKLAILLLQGKYCLLKMVVLVL